MKKKDFDTGEDAPPLDKKTQYFMADVNFVGLMVIVFLVGLIIGLAI